MGTNVICMYIVIPDLQRGFDSLIPVKTGTGTHTIKHICYNLVAGAQAGDDCNDGGGGGGYWG